MSPNLSQPAQPQAAQCAGATAPHFLGKAAPVPEPPEHVPARLREVWHKLPGCCRDFYLKPGAGCCKGMPEPGVPKLTDGSPPPPKDSDKYQLSPAKHSTSHGSTPVSAEQVTGSRTDKSHATSQAKKHHWGAGIGKWFQAFFKGMWDDLKLILKLLKGPASS
jgi:hypothetical protein